MATFGNINIEYLGFLTRNLENILALFHLQGLVYAISIRWDKESKF
jgi:hypothetical protein